ncbi:hypothetical protein CTI12_AA504720 [Artemisia annua]|uniref:Uncharacterized protein n=1 Tax=Artemisia annua TaxID=35608 RepID=A0A2U1LCF1_ARTAN|nr:hypothetical protein CTI12_AA504720 [Artemisia annua]
MNVDSTQRNNQDKGKSISHTMELDEEQDVLRMNMDMLNVFQGYLKAYNKTIHFIIFKLDYLDHGDQNVQCKACGAMLWLAESKRGATNSGNTDSFSICCGRGKVVLPVSLKQPPELLTKLLNGEHRRSNSNENGSSSTNRIIDRQLTKDLKTMLDRNNPLVKKYRMAGQQIAHGV